VYRNFREMPLNIAQVVSIYCDLTSAEDRRTKALAELGPQTDLCILDSVKEFGPNLIASDASKRKIALSLLVEVLELNICTVREKTVKTLCSYFFSKIQDWACLEVALRGLHLMFRTDYMSQISANISLSEEQKEEGEVSDKDLCRHYPPSDSRSTHYVQYVLKELFLFIHVNSYPLPVRKLYLTLLIEVIRRSCFREILRGFGIILPSYAVASCEG
jgi:hypothetical protein